MYVRQLSGPLDHDEVRALVAAVRFAETRDKPLTTFVTVHPDRLDDYAADLGRWVGDFTNKLRIWCDRAGFGYFAIWVRENYEGPHREHLHVLLYVPDRERAALTAALRRWLPGEENVVHVGRAKFRADHYGRHINQALTYMLKQMTSQARYALEHTFDYRVRREKRCRHTGAPVATVMGKRCGISRSLSRTVCQSYWAPSAVANGAARVPPLKRASTPAA